MLSSTLNTTTEVRPLSKAPISQLLPGRRSNNGINAPGVCSQCVCVCSLLCVCVHCCVCVFTAPGVYSRCVCVHLDGLNAEHTF